MSAVLKPCPFCGGAAHVAELCNGEHVIAYTVTCNSIGDCIASDPMRYYDNEDHAALAWNRRTCEGVCRHGA